MSTAARKTSGTSFCFHLLLGRQLWVLYFPKKRGASPHPHLWHHRVQAWTQPPAPRAGGGRWQRGQGGGQAVFGGPGPYDLLSDGAGIPPPSFLTHTVEQRKVYRRAFQVEGMGFRKSRSREGPGTGELVFGGHFKGPFPQSLPSPLTCTSTMLSLPLWRTFPGSSWSNLETSGIQGLSHRWYSLPALTDQYPLMHPAAGSLSLVFHVTCFLLILNHVWYPNMSPASCHPPQGPLKLQKA